MTPSSRARLSLAQRPGYRSDYIRDIYFEIGQIVKPQTSLFPPLDISGSVLKPLLASKRRTRRYSPRGNVGESYTILAPTYICSTVCPDALKDPALCSSGYCDRILRIWALLRQTSQCVYQDYAYWAQGQHLKFHSPLFFSFVTRVEVIS